jgi:hypothetical protein
MVVYPQWEVVNQKLQHYVIPLPQFPVSVCYSSCFLLDLTILEPHSKDTFQAIRVRHKLGTLVAFNILTSTSSQVFRNFQYITYYFNTTVLFVHAYSGFYAILATGGLGFEVPDDVTVILPNLCHLASKFMYKLQGALKPKESTQDKNQMRDSSSRYQFSNMELLKFLFCLLDLATRGQKEQCKVTNLRSSLHSSTVISTQPVILPNQQLYHVTAIIFPTSTGTSQNSDSLRQSCF